MATENVGAAAPEVKNVQDDARIVRLQSRRLKKAETTFKSGSAFSMTSTSCTRPWRQLRPKSSTAIRSG
jgi:hypothetical protein